MNAFVEAEGPGRPLRGVREVLSDADLAIVNLECIIASGGEPADKGERNPYYYRGRPELVRVLTEAGIDVASVGNNHAGDYGPDAMSEAIEILRKAGVDPVGGGRNVNEAMAPVFRKVGDTVVAFIAMDMTQRKVGATPTRGGPHFVWEGDPTAVVQRVREQVHLARQYAHLVFFVTHWGFNYDEEPSDEHRELAKRLIREAGIDALLGSSAHQLQGMEVIDGKPVIYDAGNLLFDFGSDGWTHKTAIFVLHFDQVGVRWVEAVPVKMHRNIAELATGDERMEIARRLEDLSLRLGTKLWLEGDRAMLGVWNARRREPPRERFDPPPRAEPVLPTITSYMPPHVTVKALPSSAKALNVPFEGGIELIGYEVPETSRRREGVRIVTYWRTSKRQTSSYQILTHVEPQTGGKRPRWIGDHTPGDWAYPTTRWEPGQIIVDSHQIRPSNESKTGPHDVMVGLFNKRGRLKVLDDGQHGGDHRVKIAKLVVR
jgi:poly-gamma-glutamate capsule biosynthesis protein CapA/YwtB (metallophosphatase superfamily)